MKSGKVQNDDWKWFWQVTGRPLEHGCRPITDLEPAGTRRGIPNTRWIDAEFGGTGVTV